MGVGLSVGLHVLVDDVAEELVMVAELVGFPPPVGFEEPVAGWRWKKIEAIRKTI
jgi:hypothetical protein